LGESLNKFVGCVCEIKTTDNELLVLGRISAVLDIEETSIEIVSSDGTEMPNVIYGTRVKINVFSNKYGFLGLEGQIYITHSSFWRIYDVACFGTNERRGYFRINNYSQAEAEMLTEDGELLQYPCLVTSVSISGILIAVSDEACSFQISSKLKVKNIAVGENQKTFDLQCTVKRIDFHQKHGRLYGCEMQDMNENKVEKLCQAIFAQQRIEIQRRRGLV